jgi:Ca-activated chloride channel homolog
MVVCILIASFLIVLAAELLHLRRCVCLRDLLFPSCRFPKFVVIMLALSRVLGFACVGTGAGKLWVDSVHPAAWNSVFNDEETDRLLIVLDASLSMNLRDAGPERDLSRGERAASLIQELLLRDGDKLPRTSLLVFADKVTGLAIDTNDWNVIRHSLNNRNLSEALFDNEKTTVGAVLKVVLKGYADKWPERSTVMMLMTDGDSEDSVGAISLPPSIKRSLVIGVGSAEGKLIGDFQSRQEERNLQAIAKALGGRYFNCNEIPIPPESLGRQPPPAAEAGANSAEAAARRASAPLGERATWALVLLGAGAVLLVLVTLAGPFLDPENTKPLTYESPTFLS